MSENSVGRAGLLNQAPNCAISLRKLPHDCFCLNCLRRFARLTNAHGRKLDNMPLRFIWLGIVFLQSVSEVALYARNGCDLANHISGGRRIAMLAAATVERFHNCCIRKVVIPTKRGGACCPQPDTANCESAIIHLIPESTGTEGFQSPPGWQH